MCSVLCVCVQICSVADTERRWCYLEGSHQGVGLYLKHGFVVLNTSQLGLAAPVMSHMAPSMITITWGKSEDKS